MVAALALAVVFASGRGRYWRAGGLRGRLRPGVGARFSGAAHVALRAAGCAAGRPGGVARDGVDADRQGPGPARGRLVSGPRGPGCLLRADGGDVRGGAGGVRGLGGRLGTPGATVVGSVGGQHARRAPGGVGQRDGEGGADGDDRDEHAVLSLPAHAAGLRARRPGGRAARARRAGRRRWARRADRRTGDRLGVGAPRPPGASSAPR